jgi:hypothetical protein
VALLRCALVAALLAGAAFGARGAGAVTVRDLYVAAVPVAQRSGEPPPEALQAAMQAVLVKLSGRRDIAADPRAAELVADPAPYVQQTGFTDRGLLRVGFDPPTVRTSLLARGLPLWGDDRPAVLLWLAVDVGGERSIVGADDQSGVQEALLTIAGERGLPLQLPLLDAEDLARLRFGDIWGGFDESLLEAAARYGADAVLIGRAAGPALEQLSVSWRLVHGGSVEDWRGTLLDGAEHCADVLADRYASVAAGVEQPLRVSVSGLDSGEAYARVLHYLQSLTLVDAVRVEHAAGTRLELTLLTRAEAAKLARQLELSGFLVSDEGGAFAYSYRP